MKILAPNYTQTPNDLFDKWIPKLNESELKVLLVVIRKTFGWHKQKDRISLSQLEHFTGLSEPSVLGAIKSLASKGIIKKETVGEIGKQQSFYELVVDDSNNSYPPSNLPPQDTLPPKMVGGRPPKILGDTKETTSKENDRLIDAPGAQTEKKEGKEMDPLVVVRNRSHSGIAAMHESKILAELEPLGFSREKIREAIKAMLAENPLLHNNTKITSYLKSILNNTKPQGKVYGKHETKRPSHEDSLRRTRETITKSSVRLPSKS